MSNIAYSNIGKRTNKNNAPRALLLIPTISIGYYVQGRYEEGLQKKMHNIYFQFLAILKCLVDHGYVVDCVEKDTLNLEYDTSSYKLILDEGDSLAYIPQHVGQKKIFYCTGTKWSRWNSDELQRLEWFQDRYGVLIKPVRQIMPIFSDQAADYILYKGVPEQMYDFNPRASLIQLAMPVEFEPEGFARNYTGREFVWIGGWGAVHKGLDLVIDAFEKLPHLTLHLFGAVAREPIVLKWLQGKVSANKNIHYHGFADYQSPLFQEIIKNCAGHIYPSAGENGCATLAQTAHFGLIPVTTATANNQANSLGFRIEGAGREAMIDSICKSAEHIFSLSNHAIQERSMQIMAFAKKRFTRQAFITSFNDFLLQV